MSRGVHNAIREHYKRAGFSPALLYRRINDLLNLNGKKCYFCETIVIHAGNAAIGLLSQSLILCKLSLLCLVNSSFFSSVLRDLYHSESDVLFQSSFTCFSQSSIVNLPSYPIFHCSIVISFLVLPSYMLFILS